MFKAVPVRARQGRFCCTKSEWRHALPRGSYRVSMAHLWDAMHTVTGSHVAPPQGCHIHPAHLPL